jgi:oligopeptide transport system permease protein
MATAPIFAADAYAIPAQASLWQDAWRRLRRNRLALGGFVVVAAVAGVALLAVVYTPYSYYQQALGPTFQPPSVQHPLGLDQAGRDILSRLMLGAQISLEVGLGTVVLVCAIGITLGLLAGFYRGWVDTVVSLVINIWYGIPDLLVALLLVFILSDALHLISRGLPAIMLAIAVTRWMDMARLVRGQTLALREREFVEAARSIGTKDLSIVVRHILPNALGPIIVQATFLIPQAILFEAFLSFLGLGVPPPTPSWGAMAADGFHALEIAPHIVLAPALALSLTLMAFNFLGDGLRDALDPRMKR